MTIIEQIEQLRKRYMNNKNDYPTHLIIGYDHYCELISNALRDDITFNIVDCKATSYRGLKIVRSNYRNYIAVGILMEDEGE